MVEIKMEDLAPGEKAERIGEHDPALVDEPEIIWDKERLEAALDTLKEMYIQVRELRTSIPRLVAPLTVKQASPEVLFKKFAAAASTANEELKRFRQLIEEEGSRKIFAHAHESRIENPKGITSWRITEHPDWLSRKS